VAWVVDGDTIAVGAGERVRLIGINTPETRDPRRPVECFGEQAAARTRAILPAGTSVRLVFDVERTDRYGRTLAYVYRVRDGLFVNAALVAEGYAQVATYPPNVAHAEEFLRLERLARFFRSGLWSACAVPVPPPVPPPPPAAAPAPGPCDPAYPGCASRPRRPTSTAPTSRTGASRCAHPTRTASTPTATGSAASDRPGARP
jgi:micrococcal nuclease